MIAVIFEVVPAPGRKQEYLDIAAALRRRPTAAQRTKHSKPALAPAVG